MKKYLVKYMIFMLPLLLVGTGLKAEWVDKERRISKSYKIDSRNRLLINNSYGTVKVNNWNRNEIKVDIVIRVGEASGSRADEALNSVQIRDAVNGRDISFKTDISSGRSGGGWWSKLLNMGDGARNLEINYTISMPEGNELTINNDYGAVELGDRGGRTILHIDYGSLKTGNLRAGNNEIAMDYSQLQIESLNGGSLNVDYGGVKIGFAQNVQISLSYTDASINTLAGTASISLQYGGGFSAGLSKDIKSVNLSADYSSVNLKPAAGASFNFNISIDYGSFSYDKQQAIITNQAEKSVSSNYTGYWSKKSGNSVNVSVDYGSLSLK